MIMAHDNEASVEEILESIKKVIARDDHRIPKRGHYARKLSSDATHRGEESVEPPVEDEVLDLAEMHLADELDADPEAQLIQEIDRLQTENENLVLTKGVMTSSA